MKSTFLSVGIASILVVAIIGVVVVNNKPGDSKAQDGSKNVPATPNQKAIQSICSGTDYKETCQESLSKNAGDTTDPKELVQVAFNDTMNKIADAMKQSEDWHKLQDDPRTKKALDQCTELMGYAIDELKDSFNELGGLDLTKLDDAVVKLKNWLSAVLNYQKTCLDGFEETQGDSGAKMEKLLETSIMLTHNGLAMVDQISSLLNQLNLSDGADKKLQDVANAAGVSDLVDSMTRKLLQAGPGNADMVIAQDGSGQYKTINEALPNIPKKSNTTFVIHLKAGLYKEYVQINKTLTNILMFGDGPDKTRVWGALNFIDGVPTFKTSVFSAIGDRFMAKNMAFENGAGAIKHQAVAIRVISDMAIFYNCHFDGYQDTLYAHSHRHFYRDCTISGTIDFIFGDAKAVFQNCILKARKPLVNQQNLLTAHGRLNAREDTGYVFQSCKITAEPEYLAFRTQAKSFLGRPWKQFSKTIFMNSYIPDFIEPQGWAPWNGNFALDTLYYAEYKNVGPSANMSARVTWPGFHVLKDPEALQYTPSQYIQGDQWIPASGVPYTPGMMNAPAV